MIKNVETATPENKGANYYSPDQGLSIKAKNQKEAQAKFNKLKNSKK